MKLSVMSTACMKQTCFPDIDSEILESCEARPEVRQGPGVLRCDLVCLHSTVLVPFVSYRTNMLGRALT